MRLSLRGINNILLALIVVINGYVLLSPTFPQMMYWWNTRSGTQVAALTKAVHSQPVVPTSAVTNAPMSTVPNGLIIPSMVLDQPIYEGSIKDTYKTLDKGIWRWPKGSTPDKGGNTVLLGHRFTYTKPQGTLYFLNKVQVGEDIALTWNNRRYVYRVNEVKVVKSTDTSILAATDDDRVTIYTCTPLWKPTDRLVVIAKRETV